MISILVIDDDPDIGKMMKMLLEYKGYAVILLERSEKAIEILHKNNIDLVIMDMLLSGTNGVDVCASFKADSSIAHIPVIMMSAHPDAKKICLEGGADSFIFKPFDMKEMLSAVNNLINKNQVSS